MQFRPDHPTLLEALAQFLLSDVGPALEHDKKLQFRALIAANLANMVAQELRSEDDRATTERARLEALLSVTTASATRRDERLTILEGLNRELADRLRTNSIDPAAAADHLWRTAKETLHVTNPRFSLDEEVE